MAQHERMPIREHLVGAVMTQHTTRRLPLIFDADRRYPPKPRRLLGQRVAGPD